MNSLLDNQQIKKRGKYSARGISKAAAGNPGASAKPAVSGRLPGAARPSFRPAGLRALCEKNAGFFDTIAQNPAKSSRRNFTKAKRPEKAEAPFGRDPGNREPRNQKASGAPRYSFRFSLLPAAVFVLLALGALFVMNRGEDMLDWADREVISAEKDPSQYNLALYAGLPSAENAARDGESIPLDLTEIFAWQSYKVKRGDSVSKIAALFSVSMDAIIASNGITNARALREGEVLRIPNMDGIPYTVKNGDSLSGISKSMGVPLEAILDANDITSDVISPGANLFIPGARMKKEELKLALGEYLFIHPVKGARLTSPFGWRTDPFSGLRRHHAAVDLAIAQGTPVKAAMDGTVGTVGFDRIFGNYIIINHAGGYQSLYAHLHTVAVKKGGRVFQGGQIGAVGNTGASTGPHLHFAIFKNSRAVNPLDFLSAQR